MALWSVQVRLRCTQAGYNEKCASADSQWTETFDSVVTFSFWVAVLDIIHSQCERQGEGLGCDCFCCSVSVRHIVWSSSVSYSLDRALQCGPTLSEIQTFVLTVVEEIRSRWAPEKAFLARKRRLSTAFENTLDLLLTSIHPLHYSVFVWTEL